MAITFSCSCGKRLQAREELAGRRIKCPACQNVLTIPTADREAPGDKSTPAVEADIPPLKPLDVSLAHQGSPPPQRWADPSLEQQATASTEGMEIMKPDRRDISFGWLKVLVALLVMAGLGALVYSLPAPEATTLTDLDIVPPDATAFLSLRLADLWNQSPSTIRTQHALDAVPAMRIFIMTGLPPTEIERVTFVLLPASRGGPGKMIPGKAPAAPAPPFAFLVYSKKPRNLTRIRKRIAFDAHAVTVNKKKVFDLDDGVMAGQVHFVNSRLYILSNDIKRFLNYPASKSNSVRQSAFTAARTKQIVACIPGHGRLRPALVQLSRNKAYTRFLDALGPILDADQGTVILNEDDTKFDLDARLSYADPPAAARAHGQVEMLVQKGKLSMPDLGKMKVSQAEAGLQVNLAAATGWWDLFFKTELETIHQAVIREQMKNVPIPPEMIKGGMMKAPPGVKPPVPGGP
jgi:hypothetical protein